MNRRTSLIIIRGRIALVILALTIFGVLVSHKPTPVEAAGNPPPVQVYYISVPEDQSLPVFDTINNAASSPVRLRVTIAIRTAGTVVYYDHWEDGYAVDIANPTNDEIYSGANLGGVQIWGDNNPANGIPPGFATDVLDPDDVIVISDDDIAVPNSAAVLDWDGKDKFGASHSVAVVRAAWPNGADTLMAFAHELNPTTQWGTQYTAPVGCDTSGDNSMFEYTAFAVMAAYNNTPIEVDANADGTYEFSTTINEGGSVMAAGTPISGCDYIRQGGRVRSTDPSKPIQVQLIMGDIGSTYELRDITLVPDGNFGTSYWSPVGLTSATYNGSTSGPATMWIYNPNASTIYVRCDRRSPQTQQNLTLTAGALSTVDINDNGAGHCYATNSTFTTANTSVTFTGLVTMDSGGQAWDWSFTLYPETLLTNQVLVGLGIGRDPTSGTNPSENGNPVWVTPVCNNPWFYVDWNNDGTPDKVDFNGNGNVTDTNVDGLNETTSQNGFQVSLLKSVRLYDPDDNQTGAYIYTRTLANNGGSAGCKFAAAWGQDPRLASPGAPGLDMGTTISPMVPLEVSKTLEIVTDADGNGIVSPGDTVRYNISIQNIGLATVNNVYVFDTVPANTTYVASTTQKDVGGGWVAIPDDGGGTAFPLDVLPNGVLLGNLPIGSTFKVRFNITLNLITGPGNDYDNINNCAVAVSEILRITQCVNTLVATRDWGDLPDTYGTTAAANGPRHTITALRLGTYADAEAQGQPSLSALNDDENPDGFQDDEDGINLFSPAANWAGGTGAVGVTVSGGPGCLNGWMDFTNDTGSGAGTTFADGNFTKVGGYDTYTSGQVYSEHIIQNVLVNTGTANVTFPVPPGLVTATSSYYMRFRLSPTVGGVCNATIAPTGLVLGGEVEDYRFTVALGTIGNYVWVDENSDGYQDAGEPGLANVRVLLRNSAGTVIAETRTDSDGGYRFPNIIPGTYYVDIDESTLPAGMTQSPYNLPGADFGNQDHTTNAFGYPVLLGSGEEDMTADFGYNYNPTTNVNNGTGTGTIGDRVWIDTDGDGDQDPEEAGLGGVTVQLVTAGPDGIFGTGDDVVAATTSTNAAGNYIFDGLTPGAYVVRIPTTPAGYTQTGDPDATIDNKTTTPILLAPGDVYLNADFGYQPQNGTTGSIGDRVWFDADADGVQDAGETGIPGVTVSLIRDSNGNGVWDAGELIIAVDTTDSSGIYGFSGLPATDGTGTDDYLVWVNDSSGVLQGKTATFDKDGAAPGSGLVSGLGITAVTNLGTTPITDVDFGYTAHDQNAGQALIGDRIWLDVNGDGVQDAGEPGIEGVRVELYDNNGNFIHTTTTDENGNYYFGGLPAGTYIVDVQAPNGMTQTFDADGLGTPNQSTVTVTAGQINLLQDFGYRGTGSVGNLVWNDVNGDGNVDAGENGLPGVTLEIYWDLDGDGQIDPDEPLLGQKTTDANGAYSFTGLPTDDGGGNARFVVKVTDEANVLNGWWHTLGTSGTDNNSQTDPYAVTLTPGAPNNNTADFGYYVDPSALGNRVWMDLDGDGIQDVGEPGLADVVVTLTITYVGGTTATIKTVTDANGFYSFGNLLLDEDQISSTTGGASIAQPVYTISVATPTGFSTSPTNVGANDMVDSDNHAGVPGVVAQGQNSVASNVDPNLESNLNAGFDFGFVPPPAKLHLDLVKTVDITNPSVGTVIKYTITYKNIMVNGEFDKATQVTVTDELQLPLEFVSATPAGPGSCSFNPAYDPPNFSGLITCTGLPDLELGESGIVYVEAKVRAIQGNYVPGNAIDNTAVVTGIGQVSASQATDDGSVVVTTPVTVAYFKAEPVAGGTRFTWQTATETANAGFALYVERDGEPVLINDALVASASPDSSTPQTYEYVAEGVTGQSFYIEDVSLFGEVRRHGPFNAGETYGAVDEVQPIDWAVIAAEHEAIGEQQAVATAVRAFGATGDAATTDATADVAATYPTIDVRVDRTGIYRLTYEQILADTGVNLRGVPSRNLALTNNGVPVPIYTFKAKFGPGAYIEFLGEALDTLYTDTNVYQLQVNPALAQKVAINTRPPATVTPVATYMETKLIERNLDYSYLPPVGSDPWHDTWVLSLPQSPQTRTFTINIDGYAGGSADTTLLLNLVGSSNYIAGPEHKVRISLNGQFVAEDIFDDRQVRSLEIPLPAGLLVNGANTLSLYLPSDLGAKADAVFIESYGAVYPRAYTATDGRITFEASGDVFKVSNLNANKVRVYRVDGDEVTLLSKPKVVKIKGVTPVTYEARIPGSPTPATYYVSTVGSLLAPEIGLARVPANINSGAADLLIIAHPSFIDGFAPLVAARQAEGLTVKVVNVLDIYATYSHGVFDAEAIREYIHHAIQNLGVDYIILGGGDTLDYRNYKGNASMSFIPSLYAETLAPVSHAPADPLYADVDGDGVPDAAIGRFPVRTVAELDYMVAKTLTYGQPGAPLTAVLAADTGFEGDSEQLAAALGGWDVDKAYIRPQGITTARATLMDALNEGKRLTSYIGHSGQRNWGPPTTDGVLLIASQTTGLTNTSPTVVTQWGCWNAYYVEPTYNTFGHTFLMSGLNGAALVTGSTTLTTAAAEQALGRIMMPQLVADGVRIGDAMRTAKDQLAQTNPAASDVLLGWTILGDPTIVINQP